MMSRNDPSELSIVGGGLAGCEAAWQAAELGIDVKLFEMRPFKSTGAHRTDHLAELVCSNSLGSNLPDRCWIVKERARRLGSLLIACADASSLPAGGALAVDRESFSSCVQSKIEGHPKIKGHQTRNYRDSKASHNYRFRLLNFTGFIEDFGKYHRIGALILF